MTEIYPNISLSTHNGDDTPQNYERYAFPAYYGLCKMLKSIVPEK